MSYFITFGAVLALILLWCNLIRQELVRLKRDVDNASNEVVMYQKIILHEKEYTAQKKQFEGILKTSILIYEECIRQYNEVVCKPQNYIIAFFLGYRSISLVELK